MILLISLGWYLSVFDFYYNKFHQGLLLIFPLPPPLWQHLSVFSPFDNILGDDISMNFPLSLPSPFRLLMISGSSNGFRSVFTTNVWKLKLYNSRDTGGIWNGPLFFTVIYHYYIPSLPMALPHYYTLTPNNIQPYHSISLEAPFFVALLWHELLFNATWPYCYP